MELLIIELVSGLLVPGWVFAVVETKAIGVVFVSPPMEAVMLEPLTNWESKGESIAVRERGRLSQLDIFVCSLQSVRQILYD